MIELNKQSIKKLAFSTTNNKATSLGLFVARIPFCLTLFHYHGMEKVTGYGTMVEHFRNPLGLGTHFTLAYALVADAVCAFLILFGIFTRPAAVLLFVNVFVALTMIHPWEERLMAYNAFFALIVFSGAGRYSLDALFFKESNEA